LILHIANSINHSSIHPCSQAIEEDGESTLEDLEQTQKDASPAFQSMKKEEDGETTNGQSSSPAKADAIVLDGKVVSCNDVFQMKKKIEDLELISASRDRRISEVCCVCVFTMAWSLVREWVVVMVFVSNECTHFTILHLHVHSSRMKR